MTPDPIPEAQTGRTDKATGPLASAAPGAANSASHDGGVARTSDHPGATGALWMRRDFTARLAELVVYLAAVVGAVALGLGITAYFAAHPYTAAYLLVYAAFRVADLLVRDETALAVEGPLFARRAMREIPLLLLFAAAPLERTYLYGGEAPRWLAALGLLLELSGLWLVLGARIQLGFFTAREADTEPRRLVRSGLYKHIRHPIYAGEFLVLIAWLFEYAAPISALFTVIIGVIVVRRRIRRDEAETLAQFGDDYLEYMRVTDALIPNVW